MTLTPQSLLKTCPQLASCLNSDFPLWLAYSGGCDSHVLLHLVASLFAERQSLHRLKAIHINHNLQNEASQWAEHCLQICESLGIELTVETLEAGSIQEAVKEMASLENAAREARYEVFSRYLKNGETILFAHHANDQMETMLYRLMRGSGPRGLAGMPRSRVLGEGRLLRPLLDTSRQDIFNYARNHGLKWVEDSSNENSDFDRNFLRNDVFPLLETRWPGMHKSWLRSSELLTDAEAAQTELASIDLSPAAMDVSHHLKLAPLTDLPVWRQRNLLRYWLGQVCRQKQNPEPDYISLNRIVQEVIPAGESANPVVRWPQGSPLVEIRRYDGVLYCLPVMPPVPDPLKWDARTPLALGKGMGTLSLQRAQSGGFPWQGDPLEVHFRLSGIKIQMPGRHTRSLSRFCQEKRIPPWVRERLPLIYSGQQLLSVADLHVPVEQAQERGKDLYQVCWAGADLN